MKFVGKVILLLALAIESAGKSRHEQLSNNVAVIVSVQLGSHVTVRITANVAIDILVQLPATMKHKILLY